MIRWAKLKFGINIPIQYQSNFFHLVGDIFWFGILNGTSLSFMMVYLARIGANAFHQGLFAAAPAITSMIFAIPFGSWLLKRDTGKEVVVSSIFHRIFYLLMVLVPVLFIEKIQIWVLIAITFVMYIPGTVLQVGFNDMFAEAVPPEWRGWVAGMRNAALAVTSVIISLVSGQVLTKISFPLNYQIVFFLGFLGAGLSSWHLWKVWRNLKLNSPAEELPELKINSVPLLQRIKKSVLPDFSGIKAESGNHFFIVILCLFGFHLSQYLAIPLFPIYLVNNLKLSDRLISTGNSLFFVLVFIVSTQLARLSQKFGSKVLVGSGVFMLGLYPGILALSHSIPPYLLATVLGGLAWGFAGGILYNYLLENIPETNRPPYLALYNFAFYAAILIGSLAGPFVSSWIGIANALILFAVMRCMAGLAILRWG
jgi:MFS family permease